MIRAAYPRYIESGIDWTGPIPAEWGVRPLFTLLHERQSKNVGNQEANVLSLSYGRIVRRDVESNFGLLPESFETYQIVEPNNIVMRLTDLQNDHRSLRVGRASERGIITSAYVGLESGSAIDPAYAYYLLHAYDLLKVYYGLGGGLRQTMKFEDLKRLPLLYPSLDEQRRIATFLDRETAKLDTLIAKQERLIELLQEKRQAVISHAVTKGLDPNAPMKHSGVEWLGDVPAHWRTERIKWVARMESGHTPDKKVEAYWTNCDIPWISLNDTSYLKDNDFIGDTAHQINALGIANSSARLLPPGVVVFSRDATIGRCAITTRQMAVSQHFIAWVCGEHLVSEFLLRVLRSMTQELERLTFGATVKTIGMPDVKTLVTPVPPISEQRAIVEHIRAATVRIDRLIETARRSVELSRERRAALISAAVTGKIDLRNYADIQPDMAPVAA